MDLMQESKRSKTLDSLTTRERFLKGWVRGSFFKAWLTRLGLEGLQGLGSKLLRFRGLGFRIVIVGFVLPLSMRPSQATTKPSLQQRTDP